MDRRLVRRVEKVLDQEHDAKAFHQRQDYFGPFDVAAFHLSRAELRLALLIALIESRIAVAALTVSDTDKLREQMIARVVRDLKEADQRMSMNANRLWIGLIQTRQLQLARIKETLGMDPDEKFDFDATLADTMLFSKREGLRLHAADALLEQAHRSRLLGDEPMVAHCLNQIDAFETSEVSHPFKIQWPRTACECLRKDRDVLLTFYDFPAEHWSHLRTTNPIESTFATIRLRHRKTKGSGTRRASLAMMFKLAQSASKKWRRLNCHEKITLVIEGRSFKDGIMQDEIAA